MVFMASSRTPPSRTYVSAQRTQSAEATRERILRAARSLFSRHGIDPVSIAAIGDKAGVATSTVYAIYKSKEGLLRAIMSESLFGQRFQAVRSAMEGVTDAATLIGLSASVARAIYEGESSELGLLRGAASFSPALRKVEAQLETVRYEMQHDRIDRLFAQGKSRAGLDVEQARRILWTLTSREVYRLLVGEGGWTADAYQDWLSRTLVEALVDPAVLMQAASPRRQRKERRAEK
jgi:AcrR family transcriptional regulator